MDKKKAGLVSAGVLTALVAVSPLAWAAGPSAQAPDDCSFSAQGADAFESSVITEDNPANAVAQGPTGGDNAGHVGECSTFNNNNNEGNGVGNTFNGQEIPSPQAPGGVPSLPSGGGVPGFPSLPS